MKIPIFAATNLNRKAMKTSRLFLVGALLLVMGGLASCNKKGLPKNFPEGCPNFTKHAYAGDLVDAMSPGIYEFRLSETFGGTAVLAKSTDGGVFWLENIDFIDPDNTNIIGSAIYYGFYATDNQNSSFSLFGEKIRDYGKAQYYTQREFLSREAMYKGITTVAGGKDDEYNFAVKAAQGILDYPMAMSHIAYHYDTFLDEWEPTYDTTVCGIPVTCYQHEGQLYYVDENWQCLLHINRHMLNSVTGEVEHQLMRYTPAGTFEETYAKIYEMYGPSMPKPLWSTCVRGYQKQADEWLTNEYPRSLDAWFPVYQGEGTIHDMEIGRRFTWAFNDKVCGITVKIENVPFADALQYKAACQAICDNVYKDESDANAGTLHYKGALEDENASGQLFDGGYYHPDYDIELNKEGTLTIKFEVIKVIFV